MVEGLIAMIVAAMVLMGIIASGAEGDSIAVEPLTISCAPTSDELEWAEFHYDAFCEYSDEFTALFNSYVTKRAKNGAMMIRVGDTGSYKFAKKG